MVKLDFSWKCPVCRMHQRKEPHRRLSEHMKAAHAMVWSDDENKYVKDDSHLKPMVESQSSR